MARSPAVLLLDDGELDDVQALLEEIRVPYGRVRGGAIAQRTPAPTRLLVATPRRVDCVPLPVNGSDSLVRIVVVGEDSPTLRARLREVGFDYLVRRPVHREALRLLLLHCLYAGQERRSEPRIPVGFEVSFRTGLLPRRATLADLSTRGCRLLSKWALEPGRRITVTIPQRSGVPEPVSVKGKVVRMSLDERLGADGPYSAAIAFDPMEPEVRHELEWILEERARGPATLGAGLPAEETLEAGAREAAAALDPPEVRAPEVARGVAVPVEVRVEPPAGGVAQPRKARPEPAAAATKAGPPARPAAPPARTAPPPPAPAEPSGFERRQEQRGAYPRRVPAFGDRAMRVLMARDLSMRGMRVERDSGLALGDRLHLAIYGAADQEPFLVWATAGRDDGSDGMFLAFDALHPVIAEQLEKLVAGLPAVECLRDGEAGAMGTVMSEILPN
jgi:hypothetical protein